MNLEEIEARIKEVKSKIEQNNLLKEKAKDIRIKLKDRNAQLQCDTQIKESQRYIDYFTEELRRLERRENRASVIFNNSTLIQSNNLPTISTDSTPTSTANSGTSSPVITPNNDNTVSNTTVVSTVNNSSASIASPASVESINSSSIFQTSVSPSPIQTLKPAYSFNKIHELDDEEPERKYTNLDLLKADTPINRAKISLKLHELEYKVDVEKKVQEGICNLFNTIGSPSTAADRRRKATLEEEKLESNVKISLLENAVKKYKGLYLGEEEEGEEEEEKEQEMAKLEALEVQKPTLPRGLPGARRPITGMLRLCITEALELANAPTVMFNKHSTEVKVKIDGHTTQHQAQLSKDKKFEIHVDKASEVELLIYDNTLLIGLLWLKTSDIVESLRKQKLELEQLDLNWVSAEVAQQHDDSPLQHQRKQVKENTGEMTASLGDASQSKKITAAGVISDWFDVEPVGRIHLEIKFERENANKRPMDKLGRAGAVRERKGEVHEMNGHQFVAKKLFHIMKCALCGDFMAKLTFQCEDCGLACHKKCYTHIVTRCMSHVTSKSAHDEAELKHRIPHRFKPLTIIGANWCCHCGFMLFLGFRGAQKCAECNVVCHTKCKGFVPDFCGMSMEKANLMLSEVKAAKSRRNTIYLDSTSPSSELSQKSGFGSGSVINSPLPPAATLIDNSSSNSMLSPQPSTSTPLSPKLNSSTAGRPLSMNQDGSSFQSLSHLFGQSSIIETFSRLGNIGNSTPPQITTPVQVNRKVGLDDFNLLAVLGKGNFGKVMLAEEKYTNELYAIKILKKRFVLDNDEVESTRSEKRVFLAANQERHPFLVNLHSTFQTETRIYYVMEYVSGGDLMMQIQREQFSEARAKFYACEVLLALEYFHKHGILYRDLKLDNIMLCLDGHIKLADYGLCKEGMFGNNMTNTFCGTPEFMAPEILLENKYGRAVDWWAFGVLMYEMLLGQSPFKGEDEDEIFDAVLEDNILYPINMSKNSISICEALLERNPEKRLGGGKGGAEEVKKHPFFADVNWEDMLAKKIKPPFLPIVNGRADTSNFDEEFTKEIPILTPVNAMLTRNEQQEFTSFSYVANWAISGQT